MTEATGRPGMSRQVVVGTAGHVDHGKSWLVRALTGTDPDRLKEERERGITTDLGFASLELPDGRVASIVDVPGHEDLVRTMIAGATGFDLVLLVVAADEGFMPQTAEHLDVLQLLGVATGVVVLTKCDLVDEDLLRIAREDVAAHVRGTFLEGAPVACTSAATGQGIDELRHLVARLATTAPARDAGRAARLPLDRSFVIRGAGTVATGTLADGTLHRGDELELWPQHLRVRVRDLQTHNQSVPELAAGSRAAANLVGVGGRAPAKADASRGHVLAAPGSMLEADRALVHLQMARDSHHDLHNASRVHVCLGTSELVARVRLLDADVLRPGEAGFAQLAFEGTLCARNHDRLIVRFLSPVVTIGGGIVLDIAPGRAKRHRPEVLGRLAQLDGTPTQRVLQRLRDRGCAVSTPADLMREENLSSRELDAALAPLLDEGSACAVGEGYVATAELGRAEDAARQVLRDFHAQHPLARGMELTAFRQSLDSIYADENNALTKKMVADGLFEVSSRYVKLVGFEPTPSAVQRVLCDRVLQAYGEAGFEPAPAEEMRSRVGGDAEAFDEVLAYLHDQGALVELSGTASVTYDAYQAAIATFRGLFAESDTVTLAQFRDALGTSRRYARLFLEAFDRAGMSRLVGDARVLLQS